MQNLSNGSSDIQKNFYRVRRSDPMANVPTNGPTNSSQQAIDGDERVGFIGGTRCHASTRRKGDDKRPSLVQFKG